MTRMQELQYNGNASKWKLDFIERPAEVFQSQVTLEYWMMDCAFKSFEGKTMQVQSMIVEDIDNKDAVCPGMNVDRLANKYAESVRAPQTRRLEPAPEVHWELQGTPDRGTRTRSIRRASRTRTRFNRSISIL